ncbi:DHA2 family efflux MFS transporter permease subunit [Jonesia quinghaiensis]|uniref:DHA2 family efflux MFS transporter permease subunit n=1 Tax=Jonesia quinghaiensis TaxID=262806 RepID=UPI0003FD92B5|nr:DHA2 family efflux MFS transporter permease subunit [Jonesia quinghaiensis]
MNTPAHHSRRWWGLAAISFSVALIIMDSTIVSVAIPSIITDLGISTTQVQWVQEIYTLVFAALLLVWGRVADRVGRRRILIIGLMIFGASSLWCSTADSGGMLILARAVQGVGGSMILPTTLSLLNTTFTGRERTIAFAIWGSTIGGMAAVGPVVGGWLTTYHTWNWAFLINVPLVVIIAGAVLWAVAESKDTSAEKLTDWFGALLSIVGFGALVFALIEGRVYGWWAAEATAAVSIGSLSIIPLALVAALGVLAFFVWWEHRRVTRGLSAIVDLSLFRIVSFRNGNITAMVVSMGEFGLILSLPLWFQYALGLEAFDAGLALIPLAVGSFFASGAISALSKKVTPVIMVRVGLVLEIAGLVALALLLRPDSSLWLTTATLFVYGLGVGFATSQLTSTILVDVPIARSGQGSSTQSTARQVGSALGIAVLGSVLFTTLKAGTESRLTEYLAQNPGAQTLVDAVTSSSGALIPQLAADPATAPIADAAREALTQGVQFAGLTAAAALLVGLVTSFRLGAPAPLAGDSVDSGDSGTAGASGASGKPEAPDGPGGKRPAASA